MSLAHVGAAPGQSISPSSAKRSAASLQALVEVVTVDALQLLDIVLVFQQLHFMTQRASCCRSCVSLQETAATLPRCLGPSVRRLGADS